MSKFTAFIAVSLLFAAPALADGILDVNATLLAGDFSPGEGLVTLVISAQHDGVGSDYQLFNGLQGYASGTGLWVDAADTSKIEINQISFMSSPVDTESLATIYDPSPDYAKADDTWFYEPYTNFLDGPTADDPAEWRFTATRATGATEDEADFLHLVLNKTAAYDGSPVEIYLGGMWSLVGAPPAGVTFSGLIEHHSDCGPDANEKIGVITVPEPVSAVLLLSGSLAMFWRRRTALCAKRHLH